MPGRRIRPDNHQPGLGYLVEHLRKHVAHEPLERFLVRQVPEASQEQHRITYSAARAKRVTFGVDTCPVAIVDPVLKLRYELQKILPILRAAYLNTVHARQ